MGNHQDAPAGRARGGCLARSRYIAICAALLVCAAPFAATAKPVGDFAFIVTGPGDQTDPSIDGQYVVFAGPGPAGDGIDVLLFNTVSVETRTIAGGIGDQASPDVHGATAAYVTPLGVALEFWATDAPLRGLDGDRTAAAPAVGEDVAAWETGSAGARDIVVNRFNDAAEYRLERSGDQYAPAAHGSRVAYVEGADGDSVWVHDAADGSFTKVCDGQASSVSIGGDGTGVFVAVARSPQSQDDDIEVYDLAGGLQAALRVAGEQRNPHLSGDWVAFEDVSTRYSQVVLWRWRGGDPAGLVFVPQPSETDQRLNDLSFVAPGQVRVVFEDSASASTGRDIALYKLDLLPSIRFDDEPNGYPLEPPPPPPPPPPGEVEPARCDREYDGDEVGADDPHPRLLATLELGRDTKKPQAAEVAFAVEPPEGAALMPVLVCIDSERVSAAWVTLDDEAIASPSDFDPGVVRLEVREEVGRHGHVAGVIAGKPGSSLTVRVISDPARAVARPTAAASAVGPAGSAAPSSASGCSAGGAGGLGSLAVLALALARRRNRRG